MVIYSILDATVHKHPANEGHPFLLVIEVNGKTHDALGFQSYSDAWDAMVRDADHRDLSDSELAEAIA